MKIPRAKILTFGFFISSLVATAAGQTLDTVVFGNTTSEANHSLLASFPPPTDITKVPWVNTPAPSDPSASAPSDVVAGGLGISARRLLPRTPNGDVYGGQMAFRMTVDPVKQNYCTVKMWAGADSGNGFLIMNCNGKEVGIRHGGGGLQGDSLWFGGSGWYANRFFYRTMPLPMSMTRGRTSVTITIRSAGTLYTYAAVHTYVPSYQHIMNAPSQGLYAAYTHAGGLADITGEAQGTAPALATPRPLEDETTAINNVKTGVNSTLAAKMNAAGSSLNQSDASFLAQCYDAKTNFGASWIAYPAGKTDTDLANQLIAALDATVTAYGLDATVATGGWGGSADTMGDAIRLAWPLISGSLSPTVSYGGTVGTVTRRDGWAAMLRASVDAGRYNRRTIANQDIEASWSIYRANRGLLLVDPTKALNESEAIRYFKEACGILPWIGNDLATGGTDGLGGGPVPTRNPNPPNGPNWYMCTSKGTTKDGNGFVGSDYGELGSWVYKMGLLSGDSQILQRGIVMTRARFGFRYPGDDGNGYLTMMGTDPVGVRNNNLPGHFAYLGRGNSDDMLMASQGAASVGADIVGAYQQQMREGQAVRNFFTQDPYLPGLWATLKGLPATNIDLPPTSGAPDFAWTDEENMVVAAKHGEDRFYANLFWRQPDFINGLVKVLQLTPNYARIAEVMVDDIRFRSTGNFLITGSGVDGFATPADNPQEAFGGLPMAIAWRDDLSAIPSGTASNRDGGRGTGYSFRYGRWFVGMNASYNQNYTVQLPSNFTSATDLVSGTVKTGPIVLAPKTSVVFYLPDTSDPAPPPSRSLFVTAAGAGGSVKVAWSAAGAATSYNLLRSTTSGGPYGVVATGITTLDYTDSTVSGGTTYYYVVQSVNATGTSGNSPEASAAPTTSLTSGLPVPWSDLDTGTSTGGSASISGGTITVTAGVGDVSGSNDSCHILFQPMAGDGAITAQVQSQSSTNTTARAGVMIRGSLDFRSLGAIMAIQPNKASIFLARASDGATNTSNTSYGTTLAMPYWVRLVRSGTTITGYVSPDGSTWTKVNAFTYAKLPSVVYVGLVSSPVTFTAGKTNAATFTNVTMPAGSTAAPAAPSSLSVTRGTGSATLSWTGVADAVTYTVKRGPSSSGPFTTVATGISTSTYVDYGLPNATCYYVVSASNGAGESADSGAVAAVAGTPPAPPTGFAATAASNQVALTWNAAAGATSYTVTRVTGGGQATILAAGLTATTYTDTTAVDGTSYTYGVYSVNSAGNSVQGGSLSIMPPGFTGTTLATQDVGTPLAGAASYVGGTGTYTLTGAGNLTGITVDGFRYAFEAVTGDFAVTARVTSLSNNSGSDSVGLMIRQSLDPSSPYYYEVMRPGYSVNGQYRDTQNGATGYQAATSGLTLPYWLRMQRAGNVMTAYRSADGISWTNIGTRTIAMDATVLVGMTATSNNASILSTTTFDNYAVVANSAAGGTATASTQSTGAEAAKAFDGSTATKWYNNQLGGAGWLQYQFAAGAAKVVTRYDVTSANDVPQRDPKDWQFQGSNDGTNWVTLDTRAGQVFASRFQTNSYTIPGNATAYAYHRLNITANSGGSGYGLQLSELAFMQTAATAGVAPPEPAEPFAAWSNARIDLAWPATQRATGYNLKRSTTSGGPYTTIATNLTATSYSDTGLTNGTTYYYVLTALNAAGESAPSEENSARPIAAPGVPAGLGGTAGDAQATLAWTAVAGADSYNVKRATTSGGPYVTLGATATPGYTDAGLANGTTYYYVVSAVNLAAESANSAQAAVTPVISAPGGLSAALGAVSGVPRATVSWNAVNGATGYTLKRSATSGGPYTTVGATGGTSYLDAGLAYGTTYYYVVTATNGSSTSANSGQLVVTPTAGVASASSQNGTIEGAAKAFDAASTTKWYNYTGTGAISPAGWLQYQFENGTAKVVKGYTLTSANDMPQRDPKDWQFQGSNDGTNWTTLDTQTAQAFSARYQTKLYAIGNATAYKSYRLNVTANSGGSTYGVQLGEMKFLFGLSAPWSTADIGAVGATGAAGADSGIFTLVGSGVDINGTADEFRYVYQTASGDCDVTARVNATVSANTNCRAGVMIRETLNANAAEASVTFQANNSATLRTRAATAATTTSTLVTSLGTPYWVRMTRVGNVFTAYLSPDGTTWTQIGSPATIAMGTSVLVGLPGTSVNDGSISVFTLDNVTANP